MKKMVIKGVWIYGGRTGGGLCEEICPEVFKVEDEAMAIEDVNYKDCEEEIA
jgi:ferredoxin